MDDTKDISSKDPVALSSAIKVWHGIRTTGNVPAERGNALQLDNSTTDPLHAIAGRYAIIQPQVISGDVSGYYLKINGAPDYFKVDYTKPRNVGRQMKHRNNAFLRMDSLGGNLDSAIVVVLPSDLHVPDTICMTYWAYDNAGNVSNPVTRCIIISTLGTNGSGAWINGSWRFTAGWEKNMAADTIIYNTWVTGGGGVVYQCSGGIIKPVSYGSALTYWVTDSSLYKKLDFVLSTNGALAYEIDLDWKDVDTYHSTCNNIVFDTLNLKETEFGAWSYNSTTKKLIIVLEFSDTGNPIEEAFEFDVVWQNDKNAIWIDNLDPTNPLYYRVEKL